MMENLKKTLSGIKAYIYKNLYKTSSSSFNHMPDAQ